MNEKAETRSVSIGLRIKPSLKSALDEQAEEETRSIAGLIERAIVEYLKARGKRL